MRPHPNGMPLSIREFGLTRNPYFSYSLEQSFLFVFFFRKKNLKLLMRNKNICSMPLLWTWLHHSVCVNCVEHRLSWADIQGRVRLRTVWRPRVQDSVPALRVSRAAVGGSAVHQTRQVSDFSRFFQLWKFFNFPNLNFRANPSIEKKLLRGNGTNCTIRQYLLPNELAFKKKEIDFVQYLCKYLKDYKFLELNKI